MSDWVRAEPSTNGKGVTLTVSTSGRRRSMSLTATEADCVIEALTATITKADTNTIAVALRG